MRPFFKATLILLAVASTVDASPNAEGVDAAPNQAGQVLTFEAGRPPMTFHYETSKPASYNWVGVWKADDHEQPGDTGDASYEAWGWAPGKTGDVHLTASRCLQPGKFNAYLLQYGNRVPLVGPVPFDVSTSQSCSAEQCKGTCVAEGSSLCLDGTLCSGSKPQCTVDNKGKMMCCAQGQVGMDGACTTPGDFVCCPSGQTSCNGACISAGQACEKPQCGVPGRTQGANEIGKRSRQDSAAQCQEQCLANKACASIEFASDDYDGRDGANCYMFSVPASKAITVQDTTGKHSFYDRGCPKPAKRAVSMY